MDRPISELLDLPEQVHRGDFVLNLSEGVTGDKAGRTLADYVVTEQLAAAFDNALGPSSRRWTAATARPPTCTARPGRARATSWPCSTCSCSTT
jgi:hypothetical protein